MTSLSGSTRIAVVELMMQTGSWALAWQAWAVVEPS